MRDDFVFKLGKQPKRTDSRTLQLARYLTTAAPPAPASINWGSKVTAWGMLGNDTVGDCAWAGQAHADMLWTANTESAPVAITTAQVLAAYSQVTGYNPADNGPNGNPTDKGTNLLDALKFWRTTGIDGQTITAFVEVDPTNQANVKLAIDLFGCLYVGVQLPDSVLPTSPTTIPQWTVSPDGTQPNAPDPNNGHCVLYSAYDDNGLTVVTWGQTVNASWAFHAAYCDELYAMLAPSWFGPGGQDPQGLDLATLQQDLNSVASAASPTPPSS